MPTTHATEQDKHHRYVNALLAEERLLIRTRDDVYDGSWTELRTDLLARLRGDPWIASHGRHIRTDLAAVDRLQRYEQEQGVNLADFLDHAPSTTHAVRQNHGKA